MEYLVKSGHPEKQRNACVIVGIFDYRKLSEEAEKFDTQCDGALSAITRRGDIDGRLGQTLIVYNPANTFCDRLLLVGCGREREFGEQQYRRVIEAATQALLKTGSRDAASFLSTLPVRGRDEAWKLREAVLVTEQTRYKYDTTKQQPDLGAIGRLKKMVFTIPTRKVLDTAEDAVVEGTHIAHGITTARELGNLPPNICTPSYLADQALALAKSNRKLKTDILEEADMEKLGMGALLAVSRGSREPAKMITMHYNGGKKGDAPIALVGKGVTFDAGGISLKPAAAMDEMKFDMCGAASVMGVMTAVADLGLPINIIATIAASENLPDGHAVRPGDVVTSMSGKTIEILNTDAEGRLLLCDALTYVQTFSPKTIIDVATLTGACVVALGNHASGLYSTDKSLTKALTVAGEQSGDRVWEMPMWREYRNQLHSNFADLANVGGRNAGSITAACFLKEFVSSDISWAHLDIAGTAWKQGAQKGATGRPVPMLLEYLSAQVD